MRSSPVAFFYTQDLFVFLRPRDDRGLCFIGGFEMSDAIVVTNAYKKFGKADDPIWTRVP